MSEADGTIERFVDVTVEDEKNQALSHGIHVDSSGTVAFVDAQGATQSKYLLAGVGYKYRIKKILNAAAGTTASGITLLYYV